MELNWVFGAKSFVTVRVPPATGDTVNSRSSFATGAVPPTQAVLLDQKPSPAAVLDQVRLAALALVTREAATSAERVTIRRNIFFSRVL